MIFQDPMTSLNPYLTVEEQLVEPLLIHGLAQGAAAQRMALAALQEVGVPDAERRIRSYPHQFSGGMRQRVMIAMALIAEPDLLIADEPTTALDVTVQAQILDLIEQEQRQRGVAVILISHDLGVVAEVCDRVMVMYAGRVVGKRARGKRVRCAPAIRTRARCSFLGPALQAKGAELYTVPGLPPDPSRPIRGCPFAPRCEFAIEDCSIEDVELLAVGRSARIRVLARSARRNPGFPDAMTEPHLELRQVKTHFPLERGFLRRQAQGPCAQVDGVSLSIAKGEVLGLVGESGCGKSTLARTILSLVPLTEGAVILAGRNLAALSAEELRASRAGLQMIFQDPFASLNPRMTVHDTIAEAIQAHRSVPAAALAEEVASLLQRVGLAPRFSRKYPHEFSGGQRQRIADRAGTRRPPGIDRRRRARLGARRLDPGADHQPARAAHARARPDDDLHLARPCRRAPPVAPDRGDVPGQDRRARARG
jgi:ABC-type glutathione transport system ATPase component